MIDNTDDDNDDNNTNYEDSTRIWQSLIQSKNCPPFMKPAYPQEPERSYPEPDQPNPHPRTLFP